MLLLHQVWTDGFRLLVAIYGSQHRKHSGPCSQIRDKHATRNPHGMRRASATRGNRWPRRRFHGQVPLEKQPRTHDLL